MPCARIDLAALPPLLRSVGDRIRAAGGRAWTCGGTVRDQLLGQAPRDYDVATDLRPEQIAAALPEVDRRDERFGVCRLAGPPEVSITTLRREAGYHDQRRPDRIEFVHDLAVDAQRRDFTVNALYGDLATGEVVDPVAGLTDLRRRTLVAIGDPAERFREDPLRLLRLLRFHARCGLAVDAATAVAARAAAPEVRGVAVERVYDELTGLFTGPGRGSGLRAFVDLGLAAALLPEVAAMDGVPQPPEYHPEGCVLTHVALVLDHVPAGDPVLAWSAVLHDIGKPPTFVRAADRIRFDGHDVLSAKMADAVLLRLRAPNDVRAAVVDICADHIRFATVRDMRPRRLERWLRSPRFAKHLAFHRADCLGSHGKLDRYEFAAAALAALPPERPRLVDGKDVLALGVASGPAVGALLAALEAQLDELPVAPDRATALVLLRDLATARRQDLGPEAR
ncbi:MAG: CCA tRNA nucleotidyltransferase [Planctomycetes bacterium]|nr:CCA tRNA nucleotidyltransferase [Planctomycetota bacterium]